MRTYGIEDSLDAPSGCAHWGCWDSIFKPPLQIRNQMGDGMLVVLEIDDLHIPVYNKCWHLHIVANPTGCWNACKTLQPCLDINKHCESSWNGWSLLNVTNPVSASDLHQCITDYHSSKPILEEALKLQFGPHPVLSSPGHTRCPPVTSRWWCTGNDQACILAPCEKK